MAKGRVKIEVDDLKDVRPTDSREKIFKSMLRTFQKAVSGAGVISEYKQREFYESPGERRRRKQRESARERAKERARERKEPRS